MLPFMKKPSRFQTFLRAIKELGNDSHSDTWGDDSHSDTWDMQFNSQRRSSYDDACGLKRMESTPRKKHRSSSLAYTASDHTTKPASELRKPPAEITRADSYSNLQRDRDSEDYHSSDQEHGGAVLNHVQKFTGPGDASAELPPRSEAEIVEDIVNQLPQLSRSGMKKVLSTLLQEPNHDTADPLAWVAFKHLHDRFPNCTPMNRAQVVINELCREKDELLDKYESMHSSLRKTKSTLQNEQHRTDNYKKRADDYKERAENGRREVNKLQLKVEELSSLHVRSMNGIGAGLDPITDKNFSTTLDNHHKSSYNWCRKNIGAGGRKLGDTYDQLPEPLKAYFTAQCHESVVRSLQLSRAADIVLWKALHDLALKPWFPVNIPQYAEYSWEGVQASFSRPDDPEHQQRIEFWRGYTACLAFKSPDFQAAIDTKVENLLSDFVPIVAELLYPGPPMVNIKSLRKIIRAVYITAAEMKCQRGHYEIEQIPIGAEFDEDSMENADKASDLDDQATHYVRVVLSEGIVKRPYRGSLEQVGRVWTPQVFVREKTKEIVTEQLGDCGGGAVVDGEDVVMS